VLYRNGDNAVSQVRVKVKLGAAGSSFIYRFGRVAAGAGVVVGTAMRIEVGIKVERSMYEQQVDRDRSQPVTQKHIG
jgi:hypothetical protein